MELLPIGTVVTLNDGEQELMITARFPLYDNNGTVGYFDYAGCFYPQGQFNEGNYFLIVKILKRFTLQDIFLKKNKNYKKILNNN